jgi:hypothetical protein
MNHRLALVSLAVVTAALLVVPTGMSSATPPRPMTGSCDAVPVIVQSPDPGALFRVLITGTCRLTHLGLTELNAIQDIFPTATGLVLVGSGSYTAADGDSLFTRFSGPVVPTGPDSVAFSGTETYVGGTGRFDGASGSDHFVGSAVIAPPGVPSIGSFAIEGSIAY